MSEVGVSRSAAILGAAGLIPFIAGAGYLLLGPLLMAQFVFNALVGYGAVILSFMGAIHWGLALRATADQAPDAWFAISVAPALVGWGAVLLGQAGAHHAALLVLMIGFIGVLLLDRQAIRQSLAPAWYWRLRWPLTLVVIASLAVTTLGF